MSWDISLISLDYDPLVVPGQLEPEWKHTYIRELSRYLGGLGLTIDVYSRRSTTQQPNVGEYSRGTRVVRIPIGPPQQLESEKIIPYLKEIAEWIPNHQIKHGLQYKLVHSYTYTSGTTGIHLKKLWGIPFVHTFHSLSLVEQEIFGANQKHPEIRRKIEKLICSSADRLIANNSQERIDLMDLYRVDPRKIAIIPSGIDLDYFQPLAQNQSRQEIAFPSDIFLITYVGELDEQSGLDTLLRAIQLADNSRIQAVIVGGPSSEKPFLSRVDLSQAPFQQYLTLVDELGLDKQITFVGGKPRDQLATYFSAGDITVVPSLYEPYGLVAKQALACGSSVIAARVSGLISAVQENQVGSLYEPGNAAQLAEKIRIIFDQPKINTEMRKNARPFAEENFSWKSVALGVRDVYQAVVDEVEKTPEN